MKQRGILLVYSAIATAALAMSVCKTIAESSPALKAEAPHSQPQKNAKAQSSASAKETSDSTGSNVSAGESAVPVKEAGSAGSKPGQVKPVLPSDQFFGKAQTGYEAAKQCPDVIAKLFCYCGCDLTDAHTSLLDCFTSDHGADCEICQDEAIIALDMKKKGKTIAEIQQFVDKKWVKEYPFDKPSRALQIYRDARTWHPANVEQGQGSHSQMLRPPKGAKPKVLPGKKVGNCCGGSAKKKVVVER